jgi:tetratricopeptide (TPR) repeat protein
VQFHQVSQKEEIMRTRTTLYSSLFLMLALASLCPAQSDNRDLEKEKPIWQELKSMAPASVETFKAATDALDKGDFTESARLYEEVLKKAPQFDPALRRRGFSLVELGRVDEGMALLEKAVQIKRSPENLNSLAQNLAFPGEGKEGSKANKERALELAKLAEQGNAGEDPSYPFLVAQLSLDLDREEDFRRVMKTIGKNYPDLMGTHYFGAVLAAMDSDWIKAEDEIAKARSLGLPPQAADAFLASGIHTRATVWRYAYYSLYLVAAWAVGLALLFAMGKLLSNLTLRSLEASDPNDLAANREVTLRKVYKKLINIAGFYYYISIPVVIFLVLAVAGSVTYGFLLLGRIPIKLLAILIIGALVTVYKMIRSLFIRVDHEDPGRALREDEAPLLWALVRDVANTISTRPVDEIRVTQGTDIAVYEKGSFTERMGDRGKRILILGVGVLNGFKQNGFRAVLAHEYGHLSHRDTAGGDVALRVNSDMIKFGQALILSGQAVFWNIAFQFLRAYHFIFRRISHGATRLQEVMADRVAVRNYGAPAFQEGLTHVIRRQVEFEDVAYWEVRDAAKAHRAIQNIYDLSPAVAERVEDKINEEINRSTSEDATHPGPRERFRLAARIVCIPQPPAEGMVWDLFADKAGLTSEMSLLIDKQVKAAGGYDEVYN